MIFPDSVGGAYMLRRLMFASCYVYSPSGAGPASARSRLLCELLKAGDAHFIHRYAGRVHQQVANSSVLAGFLGPAQVLVPIPGCSPRAAERPSVVEHLAEALVHEGLGRTVWTGVRRVRAVRKSATSAPGSRPTVAAHYHSFAIESLSTAPEQIVLIDDVVTKGRTLLAAAARVHEAFPDAQIRAFALLRTMGLLPGVSRLLEPCIGEIRWKAGDACRSP